VTEAGVDALVRAVLYEGYALYPYRPSALKNRKRFAFGVVYPRAWAERALEAYVMRVEMVAEAAAGTAITVTVRCLQLAREGAATDHAFALAPYQLGDAPRIDSCARPASGLALEVELSSAPAGDGLWRFAVEIRNAAELGADADREAAMDISPASTHVIASGATWLSSIDPPPHATAATACCRSSGLYPILAGQGAMLASPIILPDYPEIAPQSPGDFFDGTEIDEMLTLRILTMTDAEKLEAAAADPRVAAMIERTEQLGIAETARLHGVVRTSWPRQGTRVRLHPARRNDAFDMVLAGKVATVAAVERDFEGRIHCAVTLDDDPGADLPGHRFFFRPEELEVVQ
jgi:hypothetical protein